MTELQYEKAQQDHEGLSNAGEYLGFFLSNAMSYAVSKFVIA